MSSIEKDLQSFTDRGISLTVKNGSLCLKAKKKELVTPNMRKWCADHKAEIVQMLIESSPAPAPAIPVVPTPVQDQSFANLAYLVESDTRLLQPDEVIQIAITLTQIGVRLSEDGGMIAPIGLYSLRDYPHITREHVIRFVLTHEPVL